MNILEALVLTVALAALAVTSVELVKSIWDAFDSSIWGTSIITSKLYGWSADD